MKKIVTSISLALLPFFISSQTISSVSPATANAGQTLNVTITGTNTHFQSGSGTSVSFSFNQVSGTTRANSINIISETSIQANVTVPANTPTGDYSINVNNTIDGSQTLSNDFHVNGIQLISINPANANAGQTLNVTITGANTHFQSGSGTSVSFNFNQASGTTVVNSLNIVNDTSLQANITVPSNTYTGNYNVDTYNSIDGNHSLNNAFQVNGLTPPSISAISPATANAGQTLNVTITGANTHFQSGSGTSVGFSFNQGSSTINSINASSETSITVNVTVPSNTYTGNYNVSVYNSIDGNQTLSNGFHVNGVTPPAISAISPDTANAGQTLNVTITGASTHFQSGSGTSISFNFNQASGTTVINSKNIISETSIQANITIPTNTAIGNYNVTVYNSVDGSLSLTNGFHIIAPKPMELSIQSTNVSSFGLCDGTAKVVVSNGTSPYTYKWSSGETTGSISSKCSNKYNVIVTDVNGLKDSATAYISEPTFTIINTPTSTPIDTLTANVDTCIINYNYPIDSAYITTFNMTDSSHVLVNYAIFQNGKKITFTNSFKVSKSGENLLVLDLNCSGTFTRMLKTTIISQSLDLQYNQIGTTQVVRTGITEIIPNTFVNVYPNPFSSQTTLTLNKEVKDVIVRITDVTGKEIRTEHFSGIQLTIERGNLNGGFYFIQVIENNTIIATRKIVIQ